MSCYETVFDIVDFILLSQTEIVIYMKMAVNIIVPKNSRHLIFVYNLNGEILMDGRKSVDR